MKLKFFGICSTVALALAFALASCAPAATGEQTGDSAITLLSIPGVTAPVQGTAPVASVDTDQYTGTVTWSPAVSGTFAAATVYTATIELAVKPGYTLSGVAANAFTVDGASSASNAANAGTITALFPATSANVVAVTDLDFAQSTVTLKSGKTITLVPVFTPVNATNKALTWSSGNSAMVTVDASGKVTAITDGSVEITATSADGSHVATCTVTVKDPTVYWSGKNAMYTPARPGYWNGTAWTSISNQAYHTTGLVVRNDTVYTAGYAKDTSGSWRPALWVNSTQTFLVDLYDTNFGEGYTYGITGDANAIYVTGNLYVNGVAQPCLLTCANGGVATTLLYRDVSGTGRDVEVEDSSVYVCGYWKNPGTQTIPSKYVPCIWTDGVIAELPVPDQTDGYATTLAVRAGKTYVGGFVVSKADNSEKPCVWVDGSLTVLNGKAATGNSRITGIDVYGDGNWIAVGWTSTGTYDPARACRWNNSADLSYLSGTDTLYLTQATGVDILYDEVYISGTLTYANGDQSPLIWKNDDTPTSDLNNGFTTGVFIQP